MKVAIVTPTIGSEHLQRCLDSVRKQSYKDIEHYIFIDGKEHEEKVRTITKNETHILLEQNVGKGWYGHRVYSACSFLVNADAICYLDEDNWFEPEHVKELVRALGDKEWAYSLRKIYDKQGEYLCEDNCESLGKWPVYFNDKVHHIDTSSFIVRRDIAVRIGHAWYGQWGADRQFFTALSSYFPNYNCSGSHSLCYRLDGNPNSVTKEFFDKGNQINQQKYNGEFPWKEKQRSLQVAPGISVLI